MSPRRKKEPLKPPPTSGEKQVMVKNETNWKSAPVLLRGTQQDKARQTLTGLPYFTTNK